MLVFNDSDPDGFCGAWVLSTMVEEGKINNPDPRFKIIPVDHGKEFPMGEVQPGETVFIVDYSLSVALMDELYEITEEVYWIDHHVSAMDKLKDYPREIKGLRDVDYASCENCYRFAMGEDAELPPVVKLVGDFDTWRWQYLGNRSAYHFILGISMEPLHPDTECWERFENNTERYINFGKVIDKHKRQEYSDLHEKMFELSDFHGHKALVLNAPMRGFFPLRS